MRLRRLARPRSTMTGRLAGDAIVALAASRRRLRSDPAARSICRTRAAARRLRPASGKGRGLRPPRPAAAALRHAGDAAPGAGRGDRRATIRASSSASATASTTASAACTCRTIFARPAGRRWRAGRDWIWITGNHDPDGRRPAGRERRTNCIGRPVLPPRAVAGGAAGEIAGHLHPCARIVQRRARSRCAAAASLPTALDSSCPPSAPTPARSTCSTAPMAGLFDRGAGRAHARPRPHLFGALRQPSRLKPGQGRRQTKATIIVRTTAATVSGAQPSVPVGRGAAMRGEGASQAPCAERTAAASNREGRRCRGTGAKRCSPSPAPSAGSTRAASDGAHGAAPVAGAGRRRADAAPSGSAAEEGQHVAARILRRAGDRRRAPPGMVRSRCRRATDARTTKGSAEEQADQRRAVRRRGPRDEAASCRRALPSQARPIPQSLRKMMRPSQPVSIASATAKTP